MSLSSAEGSVTRCAPTTGVWGGGYGVYSQASDLVTQQFKNTEGYASEYSDRVATYMTRLVDHIRYAAPDLPDMTLEKVDSPAININSVAPPVAPGPSNLVIPDKPLIRGELQSVVIEGPEVPIDTILDTAAPSFSYEETPYFSQMLENLKNNINAVVLNGGVGLPDPTFESILNLAVTADELEYEKAYRDAENYYASKNYQAPPGALVSRLNMLTRERYRNQQRIISELSNKQAELAYNQEALMSKLAIDLETLSSRDRETVANRAYQLAKDIVAFHYTSVEQSIKINNGRIEAYKARWAAEETKVRAVSGYNKSITDTLVAEISAWEAGITAELGIIEQITKVYVAEMSGYESAVKVESLKAEVLLDEYKANISQASAKASLSVEEAKLALQNALNSYNVSSDALKSMGSVAAQITSSALSAFNTSASLSAGVNFGNSFSNTTSKSCTNTGSEGISVSKNYNYSVGV